MWCWVFVLAERRGQIIDPIDPIGPIDRGACAYYAR